MLSFEINNSSHLIKIRSIKKENDAYIITGFPGNYFTNETLEGEMFQNFPKADAEGCVVLKLEKNGERLFLYDWQNGSLIAEFMMASKEWIRLFEDYIYENRRPAGLEVISNGEESQSDSLLNTSIATVSASENQGMEESKSTNSPTTECAEPAEEAALSETAESESPNEKAANAKESSALPIVPIAAGGAVLAILLTLILFAVAKKRKAKKSRLKSASTNFCAAHFGK